MAKLGMVMMSVIAAAVTVTSCGQGEKSLFADVTVASRASANVRAEAPPSPPPPPEASSTMPDRTAL